MERLESIATRERAWTGDEESDAALRPFGCAQGRQALAQASRLRRQDGDPRSERSGQAPLFVPISRVRDDALPENIDYEDRGCEVAPRCLECPLPRCRYDERGGLRGLLNRDRDRRIAELGRVQRVPVNELAGRFGVSRRTVFRILQKTAPSLSEGGQRA